jgi:pimeloyl-ACP methyl ester carboxylesterase
VSPYLFPRRSSPLQRLLVQTPLLGPALLRKVGPGVIERFVADSCSPGPVPPAYREASSALLSPRILRTAVVEKAAPQAELREALSALSARKIPVAVVWSREDRTSTEAEQLEPLRALLPVAVERRLDAPAGHAIPWTHPGELAEAVSSFFASNLSSPNLPKEPS